MLRGKLTRCLDRNGALVEPMNCARGDGLADMTLRCGHRPTIATTNPLEGLNGEIKRRTDVVGILLNDRAVVRMVGVLIPEQTTSGLSAADA
jgi:transposase-like protein